MIHILTLVSISISKKIGDTYDLFGTTAYTGTNRRRQRIGRSRAGLGRIVPQQYRSAIQSVRPRVRPINSVERKVTHSVTKDRA